jgi:hypothetical protein
VKKVDGDGGAQELKQRRFCGMIAQIQIAIPNGELTLSREVIAIDKGFRIVYYSVFRSFARL